MRKFDSLLDDLKTARGRLLEALDFPKDVPHMESSVQRFEYSFELSWKVLQGLLKREGVIVSSPAGVFRAAAKEGLLDNIEDWMEYLKMRNLTVHTYREDVFKIVIKIFPKFVKDVEKLLEQIDKII